MDDFPTVSAIIRDRLDELNERRAGAALALATAEADVKVRRANLESIDERIAELGRWVAEQESR